MIGAAERLARLPLRTQLLALLLGSVAVVVLATSLVGTAALRSYLVDRIDAQLRESIATPFRGPDGFSPRGRRGPRDDVAVTTLVYGPGGNLVADSGADDGRPGRRGRDGGPDIEDPRALGDRPVDVADVSGQGQWRVLAADGPAGGTVVVAVALSGVRATVSQLLVINAAVGLLALVGGGALAAWAVRRSLRPLVRVEETAEVIAGGDLTVRVPYASAAQARASEGRMRRFVADASHELRTPLTSIRGFAELFRQGAARDPDQLADVLRRIEDEAARMGLLVEDLLLLARLDSARPLRREPVDLLAVATAVVQAAVAVHGTRSELRLHAGAGDGPPVVPGDEARLHQVLTNLVGNAVAHTRDGSRVDVTVTRRGAEVVLEVRDDGEGMAPDVAARVFERFYRADASRTRGGATTTGSGLGLSIVAAIVAAHGGSVDVETAPGAGCCFVVRLPAD